MFKKLLIVLLLTYIGSVANAQTDWVTKKFGDKLTLDFPNEAKKVSGSTYISKDSTGIVYGVVIMEIDQSAYKTTLSSDTLLVRLKFIDEVVSSVKTKMPKYAIGDVKISTSGNIKTYALEGINEENKSTVYLKIFLIGDISYSLTCFVPSGLDTKNKDKFLNSFVISK